MHSHADYVLKLKAAPDQAVAQRAYDRAWRFDFSAPGFCLLTAGSSVDSHTLRAWMVHLKRLLSEIARRRTGKPVLFRSMARFEAS